jgi:hypothetical protein
MMRRDRDTLTAEESCWKEDARFRGLLLLLLDGGDFSFSAFSFCFALLPALSSFAYTQQGQRFLSLACNNSRST